MRIEEVVIQLAISVMDKAQQIQPSGGFCHSLKFVDRVCRVTPPYEPLSSVPPSTETHL